MYCAFYQRNDEEQYVVIKPFTLPLDDQLLDKSQHCCILVPEGFGFSFNLYLPQVLAKKKKKGTVATQLTGIVVNHLS